MPKAHRVGDFDTGENMSVTGSDDVYINGGPVIGGTLSDALGFEDLQGISEDQGRAILSDLSAEMAAGGDMDINEPLEQFDPGSGKGFNPVNGFTGILGAPGSAAAGTGPSFHRHPRGNDLDATTPFQDDQRQSDWIIPEPQVSTAVTEGAWKQLEGLAKTFGRPLQINSAFRPLQYNREIGGAKKSKHTEGIAFDIRWPVGTFSERIEFIQMACDAGFTGIGVYNGFIHCDTGAKRCWGPDGGRSSVFSQYQTVLQSNGFSTP